MSKAEKSAAQKAVETREKNILHVRKVEIGTAYGQTKRERTLAVRTFLVEMRKRYGKTGDCVVCGESMKNTPDTHHLDGNDKNNDPDNLVTLCASCHRIIDKAGSPEAARKDFRLRHERNSH